MTSEPAAGPGPLPIDPLPVPGSAGWLGLTHCPGSPEAAGGRGPRVLSADLQEVREWGASAIVSLVEAPEFDLLGVPDFEAKVTAAFRWLWLPLPDGGVPGPEFEALWLCAAPELHQRLADGERVLIHCRAGLGRTGLVAARLLIEAGLDPAEAIRAVRAARPGAIETSAQERYLLRLARQAAS